eukprot:4752265-Pleurochrysis_carterae.AAC.1
MDGDAIAAGRARASGARDGGARARCAHVSARRVIGGSRVRRGRVGRGGRWRRPLARRRDDSRRVRRLILLQVGDGLGDVVSGVGGIENRQ